jgi:hypothetical protein
MKRTISINGEPLSIQQTIHLWQQVKGYPVIDEVSIGDCIELLIATTYNLHHEDVAHGVFNNLLTNTESIVGWDGKELIDILYFELITAIKKRLGSGKFL